ncbi:MAG: aconitate hydratase AcnA, partial [Thaumarchaeota archaeon]|nr:aconitate hydratase AcnA [Nitrososphaerota archaeon]
MLKESAESNLSVAGKKIRYYSIAKLASEGLFDSRSIPYSIKVLVENVLRNVDGTIITDQDVKNTASWSPGISAKDIEIPFKPSRVLMQDFTGVPAIVDLAAMRSAMGQMGADPSRVNPLVPVDLIIDHSVQVDAFGSDAALFFNINREFERNRERYAFLKWAQQAFSNLKVSPPGRGICHQVNLEYLAKVVDVRPINGQPAAFPDTLVGTDSHTPMVNALGVLGWGVGGIEAEAVMLGQPYYMLIPEVVGVKLTGRLPEGATATDLVLTITEKLRRHGVVGKFVEYFGPGLRELSVPDRATMANMAPEYGATVGFFPVDSETLVYLGLTGKDDAHAKMVEEYCKAQGLFYDESHEPKYSEIIEVNMSNVEPSMAGPANPEDRITLNGSKAKVLEIMSQYFKQKGLQTEVRNGGLWFYEGGAGSSGSQIVGRWVAPPNSKIKVNSQEVELTHGAVVISAITSCTNTSNPTVMIGAGLIAKKAVEKGLQVKPYVKTSLAPGSAVVTEYLKASGLMPYLEKLGYHTVGYGCTTCIGNSGPLADPVSEAIQTKDLFTVAVLSGNRNFDGRIHPLVKGSLLMSPILVVAYGLAGRIDIEMQHEPLGTGKNGEPVYLRDIWPSIEEIKKTIRASVKPEMFRKKYTDVFKGDERWEALPVPKHSLYEWDSKSTYIHEPPFFQGIKPQPPDLEDVDGARVLALLGDRVTTDHISPAGSIARNSPAGEYLVGIGVDWVDFNSYGARRGNHEVMIRGTFANIRLRNQLVPDK